MVFISDYLSEGRENARTGKELCEYLKINRRELRAAVERERREGHPICAAVYGLHRGYYLAANKQEMQEYCASLYRRGGNLFKTRRACMKSMELLPGGMSDGKKREQ
jgi:hypothetical protein